MSQTSKRAREEMEDYEPEFPPSKLPKTSESGSVPDESMIDSPIGANMSEIGDLIPLEARSAMDILRAIHLVPKAFPRIGSCPLQVKQLLAENCYFSNYDPNDVDQKVKVVVLDPSSPCYPQPSDTKLDDGKQEMDEELYYLDDEELRVPMTKFKELKRVQASLHQWQTHYPPVAVSGSNNRDSNSLQKEPTATNEEKEKEDFNSDACTVTIKLPTLQQSLGKEESGESTFRLCDFYAPISQFVDATSETTKMEEPQTGDSTGSTKSASDTSLLERLFEIGEISPFGRVKDCETVVDDRIHNAHQIDADHFSVSPSMISMVEKIWSQHFFPSSVSAVPYKIKLYNRKGHFTPHKDTPETGLVGTFLVGLTDPGGVNKWTVHLRVASSDKTTEWWNSANGTWCAFYPDAVHEVEPIHDCEGYSDAKNRKRDYRGTIAFKLYATTEKDLLSYSTFDLLDGVTLPIGILLRHDYSVDCNAGVLKGADMALYQMISRLEKNSSCRLLLLPVITSSYWDRGTALECELGDARANVNVYPFTRKVIRESLTPDNGRMGKSYRQWPAELQGIPFVTTKDWDYTLFSETDEAMNSGINSQPLRSSSIYISAAIIVLPI